MRSARLETESTHCTRRSETLAVVAAAGPEEEEEEEEEGGPAISRPLFSDGLVLVVVVVVVVVVVAACVCVCVCVCVNSPTTKKSKGMSLPGDLGRKNARISLICSVLF